MAALKVNYRRALLFGTGLFLLFLLYRLTTFSQASGTGPAHIKLKDDFASSSAETSHVKVKLPTSDLSSSLKKPNTNRNQKPLRPNDPSSPLSLNRPLRTRLAYVFPYDPLSKFPNYIWQTWKVSPSSGDFREEFRIMEASWTELHPSFIHEVITDDVATHMIRHLYSGIPDVIDAYNALPLAVLKADFFRYLILLARGGIYTDIDTMAIKSAIEWVPEEVPRSSYGMVIGIEADPDREDWAEWYSRRIQFCQWTIQSKSGHPVLLEIVAHITEETLRRRREATLLSDDVKGVVEFTGPAVWTDIIMDFFNDERYFDMSTSTGNITWQQFTGITTPKKVGDVVVLPITCFSPGIKTMGAGEDDDPMAFVKHYFEGIWKEERDRHIGETSSE